MDKVNQDPRMECAGCEDNAALGRGCKYGVVPFKCPKNQPEGVEMIQHEQAVQ